MIIDDLMHIDHWHWQDDTSEYTDGQDKKIVQMMDDAGVDKAVAVATWMDSRRSNDLVGEVTKRYPDRFIPFGHVRPTDLYWPSELERIVHGLGWKGIKIHQGEFPQPLLEPLLPVLTKAREVGVKIVTFHCEKFDVAQRIATEFPELTFIFPHLGCFKDRPRLPAYCQLARERENVFLDTAAMQNEEMIGEAIQLAGVRNLIWGSDGCVHRPLVELAKIKVQKLPKADEDLILGGNIARLLGIR
jgi:uncharacterized protein